MDLRKENMILRRRNETLQHQCDSYASKAAAPIDTNSISVERYQEVYGMLEEKLSEFHHILGMAGIRTQRTHSMSPSRMDSFITQRSRRSSSNTTVTTTPSNSAQRLSGEGARRKSSRRSSRRESGLIQGSPLDALEDDTKRESPRVHFEEPHPKVTEIPEFGIDYEFNNNPYDNTPLEHQYETYETDGITLNYQIEEDEEEVEENIEVEQEERTLQTDDNCIPELDETPYQEEAFPPSRPDPIRNTPIKSPIKHRFIQVLKDPAVSSTKPSSPMSTPLKMRQVLQPKQANPIPPSSPSPKKKSANAKKAPRKKSSPKENEMMPGGVVDAAPLESRPRRSRASSVTSYALPSLRAKMRRQGEMLDAVGQELQNSKKRKLEGNNPPTVETEKKELMAT